MGGCYGVLTRRRGHVFSEEQRPGTPMMTLKAYLPVMESFGFTADLRASTGGKAFPQRRLDDWQMMGGNPLEEGSKSNEVILGVRKRKGLSPRFPLSTVSWIVSKHSRSLQVPQRERRAEPKRVERERVRERERPGRGG